MLIANFVRTARTVRFAGRAIAWAPIVAIAGLLAAVPAAAQRSVPSGSFTPAERQEIIAVIRDALVQDPSILRDAILALQKSEQARQTASATAAIATNHAAIFDNQADPVAGNPHGSVTLVEFLDVRCPYCRRSLPELDRLLKQDGSIRLVLKDLPILGPPSVLGAKALLAAQAQGGYLKLQSALMANGAIIDAAYVERSAWAAGMDWPALKRAMDSKAVQDRIDANLRLAQVLGIQGTPAFVVGDHLVSGVMTVDELRQAADELRHR